MVVISQVTPTHNHVKTRPQNSTVNRDHVTLNENERKRKETKGNERKRKETKRNKNKKKKKKKKKNKKK